jgi:hypothetical protein
MSVFNSAEKIIRKYLPTIMMSSGAFMSEFDKNQLMKNWADQFKKYTDSYELDKLEKAFQILLGQEDIKYMPLPGDIKRIIRDGYEPRNKTVAKKPESQKKVRELFKESGKILKQMNSCNDYGTRKKLKLQYRDICLEMDELSKKTRTKADPLFPDIAGFIRDMEEDSYIDLRLKEGKPVDKSHVGNTL